jgi:hypothetical protein
MPFFPYALDPIDLPVLGSSGSVRGHAGLFALEDRRLRIEKPGDSQAIIPSGFTDRRSLTNDEVGVDLPDVGPTGMVVNGREIASGARTYWLILHSLRAA